MVRFRQQALYIDKSKSIGCSLLPLEHSFILPYIQIVE